MNPLNEAFESSIVQRLYSQPYGKEAFQLLRIKFRELDINRIQDSDFNFLEPKDAFKINVDGLKFWMNRSQIVGVTRSNSCFDRYFEVSKRKRGQLICLSPGFWDMYSQKKKTFDGVTGVYILDVNAAIQRGATIGSIRAERRKSREGALALMTDVEIKNMNISRYKIMLKNRKFSDGSEFNLISNVYKLIMEFVSKYSYTQFFIEKICRDSWFTNYLQGYSNQLVEYVELLDKVGYTLPVNVDMADYKDYNATDEQKLTKLRDTLIDTAASVKKSLSNKSNYNWNLAIKEITKPGNTFRNFYSLISQAKGFNQNAYDTIIGFVQMLQNSLPFAFGNKNISENIMNFELFITQLNAINQQLRNNDQVYKIQDFLDVLQYYCEHSTGNETPDDMYIRIASINGSILKRCEAYIKLIEKI